MGIERMYSEKLMWVEDGICKEIPGKIYSSLDRIRLLPEIVTSIGRTDDLVIEVYCIDSDNRRAELYEYSLSIKTNEKDFIPAEKRHEALHPGSPQIWDNHTMR